MPTIGVVLPTAWDRRLLAGPAPGLPGTWSFVPVGPADEQIGADFDPEAWLAESAAAWRGRLHGVFSSSDYPGAALAAALAQTLGLPGPDPAEVLGAAHKVAARTRQQELLPAVTPRWQLVDDDAATPWPWPGPAFGKPVKGAFSRFARRLDDVAALRAHLRDPAWQRYRASWLQPWRRLLAQHARHLLPGDGMLVEQLLGGQLVTVEGWSHGGTTSVLGIVDSVCDPATGSFLRFDLPSTLPSAAQRALGDTACAAVEAARLRDTLWNVELFWDQAAQQPWIVEVNPRRCGQFADLHERVHGVHGDAIAAAIATGQRPDVQPWQGRQRAAVSVPLRLFAPCRVVAAPTAARLAMLEQRHDACIWSECQPGDELADFGGEDGHSIRYAVINVGGASHAHAQAAARAVADDLGYEFERLGCC